MSNILMTEGEAELHRRLELLSRNLSAACARIATLEAAPRVVPFDGMVTHGAHCALEARVTKLEHESRGGIGNAAWEQMVGCEQRITTLERRQTLVQGILDHLKMSIPERWL